MSNKLDLKFKIESISRLEGGKVSITGTLAYPFNMSEEVKVELDRESWDKIVKNADYWRRS